MDDNFDKYEAYLHRNVFHLPPDLLPYIKLDHHAEILGSTAVDQLANSDEKLLLEIESERQALEEEIERSMDIDAAGKRLEGRALALSALENELEEMGWGISRDVPCACMSICLNHQRAKLSINSHVDKVARH